MLPGDHPSPVNSSIRKSFFLNFRLECVVFFLSLVLCLCLESVGERNIDQVFFALDQWRCPNRDERVGWVFPLVSLDVY
jgi:hypothetical protein